MLALAYVMNFSGQTVTLGLALAATGGFFAFLSPVVGWIGVAVTGSDTSANSLFGLLQTTAATETGISPYLLAAANTSGGVLGKMISPQNLAIAAAVVGIEGKESALFRKVIWWSLGLLLGMCVLIYLQSTPVLGWMVVSYVTRSAVGRHRRPRTKEHLKRAPPSAGHCRRPRRTVGRPGAALTGQGQLRSRATDRLALGHDASHFALTPSAVATPFDAADVGRLFAVSAAQGVPMTFRSGGTSLSGQAVTDGILVDTRRHFRDIEILDGGARVRIGPGATVRQVNARLARLGRKLGPDPASEIACTLGGVVANNSAGWPAARSPTPTTHWIHWCWCCRAGR